VEKNQRTNDNVSSQNDNVRFDQSRNVLLRGLRCSPFLKGEDGAQRGHVADETAGMEATAPDSSSVGEKDPAETGRRAGWPQRAADAAADEADPAGGRSGDLAPQTRSAFQPALGRESKTESVATV